MGVIRSIISFLFITMISLSAYSQAAYYREQLRLANMLNGRDSLDLQKAVYAVENAYYNGNLNKEAFDRQIDMYAEFCKRILLSGDVRYDGKGDERSAMAQCAVFVFMTDTIPMQMGDTVVGHLPFEYNFDDYSGREDWSNMFVSRMMQTKRGNCHSMPLLYKMIMDRLGEECWLALAPNHMYIKARNQRAGWYNIELTCADFPTDAWLTASGYIHLDAIRNGIYMDTLSVRQSVALCLTDLAQGYLHKYGMRNGSFVMQCCDTALAYYPNYINAWLLKAHVLSRFYQKEGKLELKQEMDKLYTKIHELGYRKMPQEMYLSWLYSLNEYSNEYRIKKIVSFNKGDYQMR
ncbi:hypothetical protein DW182_16880 [Bacteroides sp. AM16-24]|jgi:hypothetical protein|uniref:hypothetical protein n=1 Tax=Bacteroides sp. AM16-24 TaxID=2292002 RepID=UPI000E4FC852|nr:MULTISPECIES: hypothetical protein [Bacteroides]RHI04514.1 hypothetical protein DW182_16880 [Bacteroides sp. AM16-24]